MTADPDDLADLLGPPPDGPADAALQDTIRRRTARLIRRRAWVRRGRLAVAAGLLLAAGGVAGWVARPTPEPAPPRTEYVTVPVPVAVPPVEAPDPSAGQYVSAERLELRAEQAADRATAATLYRLAGDRYLDRDPGQAARCYRLFLIHAGPTATAVAPDDSWLLMSLKTAHRKEATRDPQGL